MNDKHLCLIFRLTPSFCGCAINWMLLKTVRLLNGNPFAKVKFPSNAKMRELADMVQAREPLVDDIIGFMNGVSFPTQYFFTYGIITNYFTKSNFAYSTEIYVGTYSQTTPRYES